MLDIVITHNMSLFRVPHDRERVSWNTGDMRYRGDENGWAREIYRDGYRVMEPFPEVYRLNPDHHTVLDCHWQRVWREMNPALSDKRWSALLGNGLAWTNNTGFPGHRNCITGEDADKPFPRFDQARVCGGALLHGRREGNRVWIETLLVGDKSLTASQILERPWLWYTAVSVSPDGSTQFITRPGLDGMNYPVRVPLLTSLPVWLPYDELIPLTNHPVGGITHS